MIIKYVSKSVVSLIIVFSPILTQLVTAQPFGSKNIAYTVNLPNTEYTETTIDMTVKVLGGYIELERSWANGRWYLNSQWANLRLIMNPLDNSIKAIDRAGVIYEKEGTTELYTFGKVKIIKTATGWQWTDLEGNWINYDPQGRIISYGDHNNVKVDFVLDAQRRRTAVKDHHGETVYTFSYDANDHLISAKDRTGRTVSYQWTGDRLTKVTDVKGNNWLYGYDANGQLNQRTEPDGGIIKITYAFSVPAPKPAMTSGKEAQIASNVVVTIGKVAQDTKVARVATVTEKTGAITLYDTQYNKAKQEYTITVDDPLGKKTESLYNKDGKLLKRSVNGVLKKKIKRDGKYRMLTTDEFGTITTVELDINNNPIKIVNSDGSVETYKYNNLLNKPSEFINTLGSISTWQYDAKGNVIEYVQAKGTPETRITSYSYDSYGQINKMTIRGNGQSTPKTSIIQYEYDKNGNVIKTTDAEGNITKAEYNVQGQAVAVINALGDVKKDYYDAAGNLIQSVDPLGNTTGYTVDALSRVTQISDALNNNVSYKYEFSNQGWLITYTNTLGNKTSYQYDVVGNLLQTKSPMGEKEKQTYDNNSRRKSQIDANGNTIKWEYEQVGNNLINDRIKTMIMPTYQVHYQYNGVGLIEKVTLKLNSGEEYIAKTSYDTERNVIEVVDAAGRISHFEYDALGQKVKQIDAYGGKTSQIYNILGKVSSVTDPLGNVHQFSYDGNSRLLREVTPTGKETLYVYDVVGQMISKQDANGNITKFKYDKAGRLVEKTYFLKGQTVPEQTVTYTYNGVNKLLEVKQIGTINTHFSYERDALGNVVKETIIYNEGKPEAFTKTLAYNYDANGRKISITYPDGSLVTYAYDKAQLKTITLPNGKTIQWNNYGWEKPQEVKGDNFSETFIYDGFQRVKQMTVKQGGTSKVIAQTKYAYDNKGNVIERETEEGLYSYGYDLLDRLVTVKPPQTLQNNNLVLQEVFSYDAVGNRIGSAQQPGAWQYNADNQLLEYGTGVAKTSYIYTLTGHVATETKAGHARNFIYDASDRLISVNDNGVEVSRYAYDPLGRRISKTIQGKTLYYLYSDEGLLAELNEQGEIVKAYGWLAGTNYGTSPLWQAEPEKAQVNITDLKKAQFHTLVSDHLGTPQLALNDQGDVSWKARTEVFGNTMSDVQNAITMNLRLPGQYFDEETSSHYNYYRNYQPQLGRYMQKDPIGLQGGINLYTYVSGNPLSKTDPFGLCEDCLCPGGKWSSSGISGGAAFGGYFSTGLTKYVCFSDSRVVVIANQGCLGGGIIASIGVSASGGVTTQAYSACKLETRDWYMHAEGGIGSVDLNHTSFSEGVGLGVGEGVAIIRCWINVMKVKCPDC